MRRMSLALMGAAIPAAAAAQTQDNAPQTVASLLSGTGLTAATTTVLTLFLIAVLLESALADLFNWRPFIETFNARATRPLVSFIAAYLLVATFNYDAVTALMNAVRGVTDRPGPLGHLLTAAVLAGGSAGVNRMMVALGFRQVRTPATEAPKVPRELAWIAIRVEQAATAGEVRVQIGAPDSNDAPPFAKLPLAGVIPGVEGGGSVGLFRRFFLRDNSRFPPFGGYEVPSGAPCMIVLSARDKSNPTSRIHTAPLEFVPAQGAIIDLTINL